MMETFNWFFGLEDDKPKSGDCKVAPALTESAPLASPPPALSPSKGAAPLDTASEQLAVTKAHALPQEILAQEKFAPPNPRVPVEPVFVAPPPPAGAAVIAPPTPLPATRPAAVATPPLAQPALAAPPMPLPAIKLAAAATPPGAPAAAPGNSAPTDSATMHSYAPSQSLLAPLPSATRSALQEAHSQLKGSVPLQLARSTPAAAPVDKPAAKPTAKPAARSKPTQLVVLGVAALGTVGLAIWSWWPATPTRQSAPAAPESASRTTAPAAATREDLCLGESTQYLTGDERDSLLKEAISDFEMGRLEGAHKQFKDYVTKACDHATLEAVAILERQLNQKTH